MANQKREQQPNEANARIHVPAPVDEEDILEEVGAEPDPETGELVADEEQVRKLGAIDAETARENRRISTVANKQKTGKRGILFGTNDPIEKYDGLLKTWGPNSIYVQVKRLTGAQVIQQIRSCPRSGVELLDALMTLHGQHPEAEYEIKFKSTDGHQYRGTGRITLPDTRPAGQQVAPVPAYYPAPQQPIPSGAPQAFDPNSMMSMFQGMFDMFQRMQSSAQPRQMPVMPQMPPMPPPTDPAAQFSWMQQMLDMFQRMQGMNNAPAAPPQPPPQSQASSISETMTLMQQMFELFQRMQPPQPPQPSASVPQNPMFRGPRFQRDPNERPPYGAQQQQPQRAPSVADQFREMTGALRSAVAMRDELDSLLSGGRRISGFDDSPDVENDGPVRVEEVGGIRTIRDNNEQGSLRFWETIGANVPGAIKWIGERVNEVRAEEQQRKRPRRQQLPPGYVEVGPNYEPPPGYVAVREEPPEQDDLPPPPAHIPPPIQPSRWDAPEE